MWFLLVDMRTMIPRPFFSATLVKLFPSNHATALIKFGSLVSIHHLQQFVEFQVTPSAESSTEDSFVSLVLYEAGILRVVLPVSQSPIREKGLGSAKKRKGRSTFGGVWMMWTPARSEVIEHFRRMSAPCLHWGGKMEKSKFSWCSDLGFTKWLC